MLQQDAATNLSTEQAEPQQKLEAHYSIMPDDDDDEVLEVSPPPQPDGSAQVDTHGNSHPHDNSIASQNPTTSAEQQHESSPELAELTKVHPVEEAGQSESEMVQSLQDAEPALEQQLEKNSSRRNAVEEEETRRKAA